MLINNQQYINCLTNTRSTPTLISFVWELSKPTEAVFSTSVNPKAFWNWKGSSGGLALPYMLSETIWNKSHMESDPSVSDFWAGFVHFQESAGTASSSAAVTLLLSSFSFYLTHLRVPILYMKENWPLVNFKTSDYNTLAHHSIVFFK